MIANPPFRMSLILFSIFVLNKKYHLFRTLRSFLYSPAFSAGFFSRLYGAQLRMTIYEQNKCRENEIGNKIWFILSVHICQPIKIVINKTVAFVCLKMICILFYFCVAVIYFPNMNCWPIVIMTLDFKPVVKARTFIYEPPNTKDIH